MFWFLFLLCLLVNALTLLTHDKIFSTDASFTFMLHTSTHPLKPSTSFLLASSMIANTSSCKIYFELLVQEISRASSASSSFWKTRNFFHQHHSNVNDWSMMVQFEHDFCFFQPTRMGLNFRTHSAIPCKPQIMNIHQDGLIFHF